MAKHNITAHVYMEHEYRMDYSGKEWTPNVKPYELSDTDERIYIGSMPVTVEIPDDFDPVPKQVKALHEARAGIVAEFTTKLA